MPITQLSLGLSVDNRRELPPVDLPRAVDGTYVPPIKCQGIKTKLVPFILRSIHWSGRGRWVEPFLGSGVVLFNVSPPRAYAADTNPHIIRFYRDVASGVVTPRLVREHLEYESRVLAARGAEYYYEVRERFNARPSSMDFVFLNRSCFNGVMRFNRRGRFNVPFCKKTDRFSKAYVTKIVNQVAHAYRLMTERDWILEVADWRETLNLVCPDDFVYADPPYMGRHTDYYNGWTEDEATALLERLRGLPCGFALSTWLQNKYRRNTYLESDLPDVSIATVRHFYHVGPTEDLRNEMEEALVIKKGFVADEELRPTEKSCVRKS